MFMQFRDGGVGHKATQDWDEFLLQEGCIAEDLVDGMEQEEPADIAQQVSGEEIDEQIEEKEEDIAGEAEERVEDGEMDEYEHELGGC